MNKKEQHCQNAKTNLFFENKPENKEAARASNQCPWTELSDVDPVKFENAKTNLNIKSS